jgi:dUTP pyrophosphatase
MNVKIKLLSKDAIIPTRATEGSVGYDLYVPRDVEIQYGRQVVPLDFSIELLNCLEAKIEPRSGFSSKGMEGYDIRRESEMVQGSNEFVFKETFIGTKPHRYDADVLVGKIDWDYRGNVGVIIKSNERENFLIKRGTRIAQLTLYPVAIEEFEQVEELSDTARGEGGFESTGTK